MQGNAYVFPHISVLSVILWKKTAFCSKGSLCLKIAFYNLQIISQAVLSRGCASDQPFLEVGIYGLKKKIPLDVYNVQ